MGLVQKAFSDIITFSRSSNATRVGPTGLVEYAPHNLQTRSEEFDNAAWFKNNISVTANSTAAPNGTVTADSLIENTATGFHSTYSNSSIGSVTGTYTFSFYAKPAGRSWVWAGLGTSSRVYFDLANGVLGTVSAGMAATITNVGNGWYRCSVTQTVSAVSVVGEVIIVTGNNATTYTGNGTSGIYLWGAQLAVGPYALDYTPTTSAAVYGPRFDYDPVTLAARGLLVEESRTNLVTYSEQFDNAAWTKQANAQITANTQISPDGTQNADTITNLGSTFIVTLQTASLSASTNYTLSIYAKKGTQGSRLGVSLYNQSTAAGRWIVFNLDTGLVSGNIATGAGLTLVSSSITAVGNGWYRCVGTIASSTSATYEYVFSTLNSDSTATATTGDNHYVWGAQLEAGSFATSYIPTLASTVTRSADVASVNTLSPWFNATEGTLFAEANIIGKSVFNNPSAFFTDGTENNAIYTLNNPGEALVVSGGATQFDEVAVGSTSVNTVYKAALAFKANDFAASYNGSTPTTDTSGTVPTVSALYLGRRVSGSGALNGHLRRVAFFPRRLSNAELQALTA